MTTTEHSTVDIRADRSVVTPPTPVPTVRDTRSGRSPITPDGAAGRRRRGLPAGFAVRLVGGLVDPPHLDHHLRLR